jgi:hypothetical protein
MLKSEAGPWPRARQSGLSNGALRKNEKAANWWPFPLIPPFEHQAALCLKAGKKPAALR